MQLVLQADWHDVWHSPQALLALGFLMQVLEIVLMCFMKISSWLYIIGIVYSSSEIGLNTLLIALLRTVINVFATLV